MSRSPLRLFLPNRWVIAITAVIMQLALGSVYAWSVFLNPVIALYHVTGPQADLTFSIVLLALGCTAGFGGYLNNRFGPRVIATAGGILYGLGVMLATFAASHLFLLYLTFGIIGGIGVGLGYIVALAMLIKWFPDRRGFISGLAAAGFGGGAVITGLVAAALIKSIGVSSTFLYLGIGYLVVIVIVAQFFRTAPEGYVPAGWTPSARQQTDRSVREYTLPEALHLPRWYILWLMLALNVTAGVGVISVASPLAQKFSGVAPLTAAFIVSVIGIFNALGRFFWGWLSDGIGRPFTFLSLFVIQAIVFALMPSVVSNFTLLLVPAAIIGLCCGGGFGTMPAFAADFFGPKNAGTIYGVMLTAWSAGGILGPMLITSFGTTTNPDYVTPLYIIAVIMLMSAALPLIARRLARRRGDIVEVTAATGH
ncbi:oxalate:formate antiporter [Ktedonobacteria bacterium brp13]|nr:oxalate:formate antiporter [Ktedonobacteria bacterium brp13]